VIRSFRDKRTAAIFVGESPKRFPLEIASVARRKLRMLDSARRLDDLRSPPGNRLEALAGDRAGEHSVRINQQFRLCFVWREGHAYDVEITDYH